jgi:hypothetical protein
LELFRFFEDFTLKHPHRGDERRGGGVIFDQREQ